MVAIARVLKRSPTHNIGSTGRYMYIYIRHTRLIIVHFYTRVHRKQKLTIAVVDPEIYERGGH
jgi:hypothetical protein